MPQNLLTKLIQFIMAGLLVFCVWAMNAAAQTSGEGDLDDETSVFTNPQQAQKAENISEATAKEPSEEDIAILEDAKEKKAILEAAEEARDEAKEAYDLLMEDPNATQEEIDAAELAKELAQEAYDLALDEYTAAQELADETIANLAGVSAEEIYEMRLTMSWGQICLHLGIDPSVVGLGIKAQKGNLNRYRVDNVYTENEEIQAMTQRNLITGWSSGHGSADVLSQGHIPQQMQVKNKVTTQVQNTAKSGNEGSGNSSGSSGSSDSSGSSGNSSGSSSGSSGSSGNGSGSSGSSGNSNGSSGSSGQGGKN